MIHYVAIDTETTIIEERKTHRTRSGRLVNVSPLKVPELICVSFSDDTGGSSVRMADSPGLIDTLVSYTLTHDIVFHNAAFDFWVIYNWMLQKSEKAAADWKRALFEDVFHDTMYLDLLVRLAQGVFDKPSYPDFTLAPVRYRSLADLARDYLKIELCKDDSVRMNFAQFKDASVLPSQFYQYALQDANATLDIWMKLVEEAQLRDGEDDRLYSEPLQTKVAIASALMDQRGVAVDKDEAIRLRAVFSKDMPELEQALVGFGLAEWKPMNRRTHDICEMPPGEQVLPWFNLQSDGRLWKYVSYKNGRTKIESADPCIVVKQERVRLLLQTDIEPLLSEPYPLTDGGAMKLDADWWSKHIPASHAALQTWLKRQKLQKILTTYLDLYAEIDEVFANWNVLAARSGRRSCSSPNIQNIPKRKHGIRSLFVPHPGKVFIKADYSTQELLTLADTMWRCMGIKGPLLQAIQEKADLHLRTASFLAGEPVTDKKDPRRQAAKAVNFGVPGGLGAKKLADYAEAEYGVKWSLEEAKQVRRDYLANYPDVAEFLKRSQTNLDAGLQRVSGRGLKWWERELFGPDSRLFIGELKKRLYKHPNPAIRRMVSEAERSLVVALPSGRVRRGCLFTEGANTYFQGPASDVTKLAEVLCFQYGVDVVLVVHDEIVAECDPKDAVMTANTLKWCMLEAFQQLCPTVGPYADVEVTFPLDRWGKAKDKHGKDV